MSTGATWCSSASAPAVEAVGPDAASVVDGGVGTPLGDAATLEAASDAAATEASADAAAGKPSAGCASPGKQYPGGATTEGTVTVGGKSRSFRVHVPSTAKTPMPVVLMLHGGGGSAEQLENDSAKMDPIADREGFVTVYPNGTGVIQTWNAGACCGKAAQDGVDDVAFISALLDHLEGQLCLDERRVFVAGMSNGAMLTHRLGCELSDRIAAIAPVAGTILAPSCSPKRPVAVMQIHGTLDGHVPWDGGIGCGPAGVAFTSVPSTLDGWRQRNGCTASTADYFEQGNGKCVGYQGCQAPVVLCTIDGGGHSWPGGVLKQGAVDCPADGAQSQTFSASEAAWSFFRANAMP